MNGISRLAYISLLIIMFMPLMPLVYGQFSDPVPLWTSDPRTSFTMISGDGSKIVFLGEGSLYVINFDGTGFRQLTKPSATSPTINYDGSKVTCTGNHSINIINSDGTKAYALNLSTYGGHDPFISGDGNEIVFAASFGSTELNGVRRSIQRIFIVNADGTGLRQLARNPLGGPEDIWPAMSSDGRKIAFLSETEDRTYGLCIVNSDGSDLKQIAPNTMKVRPSISADGRKIVFTSDSNIFIVNSDGTELRQLTFDGQCTYPSISGDSSRIVYVNERSIWVMDSNGDNKQLIAKGSEGWAKLFQYPSIDYNGTRIVFSRENGPLYVSEYGAPIQTTSTSSPTHIITSTTSTTYISTTTSFMKRDNGKIAYVHYDGNDHEIFVMNADGTNKTQLTFNMEYLDAYPAWSPDGSKIAFSQSGGIFVMNADGTDQTQLTFFEHLKVTSLEKCPAWSPDGSKIAFISGGADDYEIYVMNADGSNVIQLTFDSDNRYIQNPAWSPDGSKIAFEGGNEIFVMNADGTDQTQLTLNNGKDGDPDWSPDGTRIVFYSNRNFFIAPQIFLMNADGSDQTPLTFDGTTWDWYPAWSPDGSKIVFSRFGDNDRNIYVMNDDGSGLTNLTDSNKDWNPAWQPITQPVQTPIPTLVPTITPTPEPTITPTSPGSDQIPPLIEYRDIWIIILVIVSAAGLTLAFILSRRKTVKPKTPKPRKAAEKRCPHCEFHNPPYVEKYCTNCGKQLE